MEERSLPERLEDCGYEGTVVLSDREYDDACVGVTEEGRAVYVYEKIATALVRSSSMSYNEAFEYIDFNIIRALPYYGEKAPLVIYQV